MSFLAILNTLILQPLQLFFEVIFTIANRLIGDPGLSIIALSLAMNFLVLPLYKRADAMQEEERETELRLHKGVTHIKKTFKGDERMMMLQTFYRQNNYKPTYVLKGATSLFLEIPFFIAAYKFLSGLQLLNGVSFGPIADLGRPDGLLVIGGMHINLLPIIMTAINLVSCVIFTKGSLLKTKIQLYSMAIFFLVFLYTSPAGLVFYWTLNNTFSLVKTIFYKLKNPGKVLSILGSVVGIVLFVYGVFFYPMPTVKRTALFVGLALLLQVPIVVRVLRSKVPAKAEKAARTGNRKMFLSGALFLSVLTGLLIPSAVINSSAQEFVDAGMFYHPNWFLVSSFCMALGIFVVWMGIFYGLAKPTSRVFFDYAVWIASGMAVVNYMFFGKDLGVLSAALRYEGGLSFTKTQQLLNLLLMAVLVVVLWFIASRWQKHVPEILMIGTAAIFCMSIFNAVGISDSVEVVKEQAEATKNDAPTFTLSKTGQNVIVLMMDRGMNAYVPYIFNEKPELKEQFSGFTYYPNAISFGRSTNIGTPALLGGYEYTPASMNKRSDEALVTKHNEALKVMPVLFDQNGFDVTVFDPVYANYQWTPDLSIFDDYPDISTYITKGTFTDTITRGELIRSSKRNFFCFGVLKSVPLALQETLYDEGNYNQADAVSGDIAGRQLMTSLYTADGVATAFTNPYNVLRNMTTMMQTSENSTNTFLLMTNDTTHEPIMLQEPEYEPAQHVNNTEYEKAHADRFTVDGKTLKMENPVDMAHYQTNMAAMIQLGRWFDAMKAAGVYDNTKIIIIADHGRQLGEVEGLFLKDGYDMEANYPLFMVKDFNSTGFNVSDEFMTTGDVPTLATDNVIENPVNPFTGNAINSDAKTAHDQYIFASDQWDVNKNNGNTYLPGDWYTVHDNIFDLNNWSLYAEDAVIDEEP